MIYLISLHLLAAFVWVGGMFFAYVALRPAAASTLEAAERLRLWEAVFSRFFIWVWLCVLTLLVSGLWLTFVWYGGLKSPPYVHAMFGLGVLMMAIFSHIYFAPFKRMRRALKQNDLPDASRQLANIRILVALNLSLGIVVTLIATVGPRLIS